MAGDWLKVEVATPDKPEVMRMARRLNLDRDAVFGKLIRVWAWFDTQSVDGRVDGCVSTDVDALVAVNGFAAAMTEVSWLDFDDKKEVLVLPNFERHNGETAKKRALKTRRQKKWRGKDVDPPVDPPPSTPASTREEKSITSTNVEDADASPRELIFGIGVSLLTKTGTKEQGARAFLGKHAKTDENKLAEVIGFLAANPKLEPKAYIEKAMRPKRRFSA